MAILRPRNDPVRLFGRRLILAALLALVIAAIGGVWDGYQKARESAALRAQAQAQLADLTKRQAQLNADIANLKTDRGMEGVLREQYALAAKGEGLIVIVDSPMPAPIHATSSFMDKLRRAFTWW